MQSLVINITARSQFTILTGNTSIDYKASHLTLSKIEFERKISLFSDNAYLLHIKGSSFACILVHVHYILLLLTMKIIPSFLNTLCKIQIK